MKSTASSAPAVRIAPTRSHYSRRDLLVKLNAAIDTMRFRPAKHSRAYDKRKAMSACEQFAKALDCCSGRTLQERWTTFESTVWKKWMAGENRPSPPNYWAWGPRAIVITRLVTPSWQWTKDAYLMNWVVRLPVTDSLFQQYHQLVQAIGNVSWAKEHGRHKAARTGLRLMLTRRYDNLTEITDTDLHIPERFREVTALYLETYKTRISDVYVTRRHKVIALAHFWRFIAQRYPEVRSSADVSPAQARAYIPSAGFQPEEPPWPDAREELVAELGAAFLCADLEITPEVQEDHASYIATWLPVLKNDNRAIFHAAAHAQRAVDYLQALQPGRKEAAA